MLETPNFKASLLLSPTGFWIICCVSQPNGDIRLSRRAAPNPLRVGATGSHANVFVRFGKEIFKFCVISDAGSKMPGRGPPGFAPAANKSLTAADNGNAPPPRLQIELQSIYGPLPFVFSYPDGSRRHNRSNRRLRPHGLERRNQAVKFRSLHAGHPAARKPSLGSCTVPP